MEKNFKEWEIEACIGEGAFGKVYKIVREEFGHTYDAALKVIEVPQNQAEYETIRNEMVNTQEAEEYFRRIYIDVQVKGKFEYCKLRRSLCYKKRRWIWLENLYSYGIAYRIVQTYKAGRCI